MNQGTSLWNAWVHLTNGLEREIVFRGTESEADNLREWLSNREHVSDYGVAVEYADFTADDVKEEIAYFIESEIG